MSLLSRVFRFTAVVALLSAAAAASIQPASAMQRNFLRIGPDAAPQGYTHLLCYNVKYGQTMPYNVTLTDRILSQRFSAGGNGSNGSRVHSRQENVTVP